MLCDARGCFFDHDLHPHHYKNQFLLVSETCFISNQKEFRLKEKIKNKDAQYTSDHNHNILLYSLITTGFYLFALVYLLISNCKFSFFNSFERKYTILFVIYTLH